MNEEDIDYLNRKFPKGDRRRGDAMVLLSLARITGMRNFQKEKEQEAKEWINIYIN